MKKVILTGTACVGKSTLLNVLKNKGYKIIPEAETQIVQELVENMGPEKTGEWILQNYFEFKADVGKRQAELESNITADPDEVVFFDRSAICYIGYCNLRNSKIPEILNILSTKQDIENIFFLETLSSFDERKSTGRVMKKEEAEMLSKLIKNEYKNRGFGLISVPEFHSEKEKNISARLSFIFEKIKA